MRILIKIGVIILVLAMGGLASAERVMKKDCKSRYEDLKKEKSVAQDNYMQTKRSIRTKMGKADSKAEADNWEYQYKRVSDEQNRKMEDMKQEMESLYNDPTCWE